MKRIMFLMAEDSPHDGRAMCKKYNQQQTMDATLKELEAPLPEAGDKDAEMRTSTSEAGSPMQVATMLFPIALLYLEMLT